MSRFLTIFFLCVAAVFAQRVAPKKKSPPSKPPAAKAEQTWPVVSLAVEGNRNYTQEQILAVAALKPGQPASKERFEAARDRLVATGVFESVGYKYQPSADGKGYAATFQVQEIEQVYPIRFENINAPPEEILAYLKKTDPLFSQKIPGTQAILDRYAKRIEEYLASRNKREEIKARVGADGEQYYALFYPAAAPSVVAEVAFRGNSILPAETLQKAIAGAAIGSPYTETRFRQLLDLNVRPIYEERGRIRVSFPRLQAERVSDVKGVRVTVDVVEGESYTLGEVNIQQKLFPARDLQKSGDFKTDDIANFRAIDEGKDRILQRFRREGYLDVKGTISRKIDDAKKRVDLTLAIDPGAQYQFGKLNVEGLDIYGEPAVRKLWGLKPGRPYNAEYPQYFLETLKTGGYFDNLGEPKAVPKIDKATHTVDVTLLFGEKAARPAPLR